MKAMILAAGRGTRLKSLTQELPKPMLPLGGKPLLEWTLGLLRRHGITKVAINLHHKPRVVIDYFGDGRRFGMEITYSIEERILGTAGALSKLRDYFEETFVLIYGDTFTNLDLSALERFHRQRGAKATIALLDVERPWDSGIVEIDSENRIIRFVEKPPPEEVFSNLANGGVYVLEPPVLEFIPSNTFYDFGNDLFPALIARGVAVFGYPIKDYLIDIGTVESYSQAEADLLKGIIKVPFER